MFIKNTFNKESLHVLLLMLGIAQAVLLLTLLMQGEANGERTGETIRETGNERTSPEESSVANLALQLDSGGSQIECNPGELSSLIQRTIETQIRTSLSSLHSEGEASSVDSDLIAYAEKPELSEKEQRLREVDKDLVNKDVLEQSYNDSFDLIDSAVFSGTWTGEDNRELQTLLANLGESQRLELMEVFMSAVNNQELDLQEFPLF